MTPTPKMLATAKTVLDRLDSGLVDTQLVYGQWLAIIAQALAEQRAETVEECAKMVERSTRLSLMGIAAGMRALIKEASPRFAETFCSQCGQAFGPGDHGFSHCDSHAHLRGKP